MSDPTNPFQDRRLVMSERDDGGPAFPGFGDVFTTDASGRTGAQSMWGMQGAPGMSLRDWLAGQALISIGTWTPLVYDLSVDLASEDGRKARAEWAYAQADAMIRERKR